jgi:hypothetical protein
MRLTNYQIAFIVLLSVLVGYYLRSTREGFQLLPSLTATTTQQSVCPNCQTVCPECPPMPDMTKYVLKSSVPPCPTCPDLSMYMLKTECPPSPDLSQYVLKSSIPKSEPIIIDNSSCNKNGGECPPCPRPRCPIVKCPPATKCAPPAPCPRPVCPPTVVKCKSEESTQPTVRPFLAPLNMQSFGSS